MQGLADGYFVAPYTVGNYLADWLNSPLVPTDDPAFTSVEAEVHDRTNMWLSKNGSRTVDWFHRELGKIMIDECGMERSKEGLERALRDIPALKEEFYADVNVPGSADTINSSLEKAGRVEDFFELAELMCRDALDRNESCGGHFRVESQTPEGEALRNDEDYSYVSAWQWNGNQPILHKEDLEFENVELTQRSYK
jgi:succinate dehydrogenase / fumarate reductase flavoprotein subunit